MIDRVDLRCREAAGDQVSLYPEGAYKITLPLPGNQDFSSGDWTRG